ncbi:lactate utilization protein [Clostridium sp. D2Q-11]|uniref:Lactate utilization protein n=1 Tax=Anaeromonas frigoriresistens TaxID=2683708 RepID=A0A942UV81_9FIRM|nr:lactate utilization protein [Anaeromonas frigoriresistens]MBS4537046.1 lactate utilization protein [Anaeromonas frigoriresistens]
MLSEGKEELIKNFKLRNIEVEFFERLDQASDRIKKLIGLECTVGVGNSKTLKEMKISEKLRERGNKVYDKTLGKTREEVRELKRQSLLTDWYITGSNAISIEGHIVNIDHSGNRVAAMIYGPDKVIVVVGENKICNTLEDAKNRARNIAAPLNAKRAGYNPPCVELSRCVDCKSSERVCFNDVTIEGQYKKDRMRLFIVSEDIGF